MRPLKHYLITLVTLPAIAYADGLGGLKALPAIAGALFIIFSIIYFLGWLIVYLVNKNKKKNKTLLLGRATPLGVRLLCIFNYFVCFFYGFICFLVIVMPSEFHNDHVTLNVIHNAVFGFVFIALLLALSRGLKSKSARFGYKFSIQILGLNVVNSTLSVLIHGRYDHWFFPICYSIFLVVFLTIGYRQYYSNYSLNKPRDV